MRRSAPNFWGEPVGLAADLLLPFGTAWDAAGRLRRALVRPYRAPVPVVCIGNLVAGGAGKTPVTLALADWLAKCGIAVHVITRGYGGRLVGPSKVDPAGHAAGEVGDEALLLAARAPCWVARDRAAAVAAAVEAGAEAVLLDDGFQNPAVANALSLLVVDAGYGFGNGRVIPAGPLRENLGRGLDRADAVVLLATSGETPARPEIELGMCPVLPAVLAPIAGERFAGRCVFAFAGIGRPEKFFATLRSLGAELIAGRRFPDHFPFREHDIAVLRSEADRKGACLVTTAKDFVRVPAQARGGIEVLDVEICWPDPDALAGILAPVVLSAGGNGRDSTRQLR
jgi:tetraacyldisaccharide 4'-kinase